MGTPIVDLPGSVFLFPSKDFADQLRRAVENHSAIPSTSDALMRDLMSQPDGVAATFQDRLDGDPKLTLYSAAYVLQMFAQRTLHAGSADGYGCYRVFAINPPTPEAYRQMSEHFLRLRPTAWQFVPSHEFATGASAHVDHIREAWRRGTTRSGGREDGGAESERARRHWALFDRLNRVIDGERNIELRKEPPDPVAYRSVAPVGEQREGNHSVYRFELADDEAGLDTECYVQISGAPDLRGRVTRRAGDRLTVHFDRAVDWDKIQRTGDLVMAPNMAIYHRQKEAVDALWSGRARNPGLLPALEDRVVRRLQPHDEKPTEKLDDHQLGAFRKALAVEDVLLIQGPPGTGKTRTIRQVAAACARAGERILITSHTHRAVDNVLADVPDDVLWVRVGDETKVTEEGRPYLLEVQVDELGREVLTRADRALRAYEHLDQAEQQVRALKPELRSLGALLREEHQLKTRLAQAYQGVTESFAPAITAGREEARRLKETRRRDDASVTLLAERTRRSAGSIERQSHRPLLGRWYRWRYARLQDRLAHAQARQSAVAAQLAAAQARLAAEKRRQTATVEADPAVQEARSALAENHRRQREGLHHANLMAAGVADIVQDIRPAPSRAFPDLPSEGPDVAAACAVLDRVLAWAGHELPLLRSRAAILGDWRKNVKASPHLIKPELIRYADVVAATCVGSATRTELADVEIDLALVDEAGQIGLATALIPLVRARRAVLVGDHMQLPPFLDTDVEQWAAGQVDDPEILKLLTRSAFELLAEGLPDSNVLMLRQQRRMAAAIGSFVSEQFYEGQLLNAAAENGLPSGLFADPMAFVDTSNLPTRVRRERSWKSNELWGVPGQDNPCEATLLADLADHYHDRDIDWAIIVPYRAQVTAIRRRLEGRIGDGRYVRRNVDTVDAFQGGERDVLLFGFTRSNQHGKVGFLHELRRSNVAFSRAMRQLVLVGDLSSLCKAQDDGFRRLARALRDHVVHLDGLYRYHEVQERLKTGRGTA